MLARKFYPKLFKFICVSSVILLSLAAHCDYVLIIEITPPEGGIVLQDPERSSVGINKIGHEEMVRLEAVPNEGFVFSHWKRTREETPVIEFEMPSSRRTRTAVFMPEGNLAPPALTAAISSPADGATFQTSDSIAFGGSGSDPEDGALAGDSLVWVSNLDGELGTGESINASLSAGNHVIALDATDSEGNTVSEFVNVTVEEAPNAPPTANISSPAEGDTFPTADDIAFSGAGDDAEDGALTGASLVWVSNLDGELGTGESITAALSVGNHVIALDVTDSAGTMVSEFVSITVEAPANEPPTAAIASPPDVGTFLTTDSIVFSGSANDLEDGALTGDSLVWTSHLDGQIGTAETFNVSLSEGVHTITLTATDSQQAAGSVAVGITVTAPVNEPPTVTIAGPANGDIFLADDSIALNGSANDPEDGALTGDSLVWASHVDGQLGTGASISAALSEGVHTITLTATDSQQAAGSVSVGITVTVPVNQPPTVTIAGPSNGDIFLPDDSIALNGSANDPEDGALSGDSLVWASHVDGQLGTGASISASLSPGHHTISLTATDSQGAVGAEFVSVTVEAPPNRPPTAVIVGPGAGAFFQTGVNIAFSGTGNDPEEGSIKGASLVWTSDFDGEIGTGESFNSSLSAGNHIITLTVTDSQQAEGTASVNVTVVAPEPTATPVPTPTPVPQPMLLPEREGGAPHLFFGSATLNGSPAPEGTVVTAWVEEFSQPVATAVVADGQYKFSVFQYGKRSFAGRTITFKIGDVEARETGIWESFGAELLNLTAGP